MATRIQRRRTKGWRLPPNALSVTRPGRYGNPYSVQPIGMTEWVVVWKDEIVGDKTRKRAVALAQCLDLYRKWVELQVSLDPEWLMPLSGKDLACWCSEGEACHGDILLEMANEVEE